MGFLWETSSSVGNRHCKADDEHRKCQQLSPRKGSQVEPDVRIGLAHKLHQKTEQSVKSDEAPEYGAGIEILSVKPSQDEEQHQALQQRFVKLRGCRGMPPPSGKTIPHGRLVGRPNNSPLIKLPMRPRPRPIGTATQTRSAISQKFHCLFRQTHHAARKTPMNPPWKDIPPCHIAKMESGSRR